MRMSRKAVAMLTLASMMAMQVPFSAFAAPEKGWTMKGNDWYYLDSHGDYVTDAWRDNDARTYKFYLDDSGKMLTSQLIEYSDDYYYVNGDGVQSRNMWRLVYSEDDGEDRWYYFGNDGKAYKSGWKKINDRTYHFTDGKMDYGFLDEEGQMLDADDETIWEDAVYFVGDNTTGWRYENRWLDIHDFDDSEYEDRDLLWIWFGNNGKKVTSSSKTINNVKYAFDEQGAMVAEWYGSATPSDAEYKYYEDDGRLMKGKWFKAVPSEDQNADDNADGTERWFYANSNGSTVKNQLKTINGKRYLFDENGIMQTGLVVVDSNNHLVEVLGTEEDGFPSSSEVKAARDKGTLMFFDDNGAMAKSKKTIELDDDKFTFKFNSKGAALHGVSDSYLYDNGILLQAEDEKYSVEAVDGKEYLVNKAGKVMKAGEYKDDDIKWIVTGTVTDGFSIEQTNN